MNFFALGKKPREWRSEKASWRKHPLSSPNRSSSWAGGPAKYCWKGRRNVPAGGREPSGTIKNAYQGAPTLCHLDQNPGEGTGSEQLET